MGDGVVLAKNNCTRRLVREVVPEQIVQQVGDPFAGQRGACFRLRQAGAATLEDVPIVLRIAPCTGDLIGEPAARRQTEILRLLPKSGFFVSDAVEDVVGDQTAFRSSAITQNRVFRTFGEGSPLLRNARARDGLGQAAFSTQIRSKSSLALPYIWRLMSFSR